jgi:arachidonate 5-lipoxygenase
MAYPFVKHDIQKRSSADLELPTANCRHPSRRGWTNHGIRLYKENFGEADYQKYSREQFGIPIPPDSPESRKALQSIVTKLKFGFALNGLKTGRRSTHMPGVGAKGTLTVTAGKDVPETDFLKPGLKYPVRLRHSNAAFIDDAGVVPRGLSLKFTHGPTDGPLDLIFNSGIVGEIFFDARNFWDFTMARLKVTPTNWESQKEYTRKYPAAFLGAIEAHREPPTSYADVMYASKIAMAFKAKDGKQRFMKYRLLRPDLDKESGLLSEARQRNVWFMARDPLDDRPRDYLRQEFAERVTKRGVEYVLQMQFWDWDEARDTHEVFSVCRLWDDIEHPWLDVARIELNEALSATDTEATRATIVNHPSFLGVPDAHHPSDPRSLAWARANVYPFHQFARRLRWTFGFGPTTYPAKDEMIDEGPGGKAQPLLAGQVIPGSQ